MHTIPIDFYRHYFHTDMLRCNLQFNDTSSLRMKNIFFQFRSNIKLILVYSDLKLYFLSF